MEITLATLPQATAQQVFDHCARHLLTQMKKSLRVAPPGYRDDGEDTFCAYRAAGGLKCVAGACIADHEYRGFMDDYCLLHELVYGQTGVDRHDLDTGWLCLVELGLVPSAHAELITELQEVHDRWGPECWARQLTSFAYFRDLNADVVAEFSSGSSQS